MMSSTLRLHHGRKLRCHRTAPEFPSFFGNNPTPFSIFFGKALLCLLFQTSPHLGRQLNVIGEFGQGLCLLEKGWSSKGSGEGDLYNELGVVKLLNYPNPKYVCQPSSSYTNYKVFLGSRTT